MTRAKSTLPAEARLYELWAEFRDLHAAAGLLDWDRETLVPPRGRAVRGEVAGTLAAFEHRCLTSPELTDVLAECAAAAEPGSVLAAQVRAARHAVDRATRVPERLLRELAVAENTAFTAWEEARAKADFGLFARPLARLVELRREQAEALADGGSLYDALLDAYEPGAKSEALIPLFRRLTDALSPLVRAVAESGVSVDESPGRFPFPGERQVELGRRLAADIGFDFSAGRLDASTHPFCIGIHRGDVRMTYRFDETDFRTGLFGILHEAGHGLYEQGLPEGFHKTPVDDSESLGIHESQSLLWENHVGRSRGFWRYALPILREIHPAAPDLDSEEFWPSLHVVRPSFIRVDADETTYNLHIAIRFELELALFGEGDAGDLATDDLPGAWNELYRRHLGIEPADDAEGVLQDVHWSHGSFGYFPTYTLGTMASAQLFAAARRDLGDLDAAFTAGEFGPLLAWLRERVHRRGRLLTSAELIEEATGRPLDAEDLLAHLRRHAAEVYGVAADGSKVPAWQH